MPPFSGRNQERVPVVLIVDDEALIRFPIADYLQECGWHVLEASSAAEAVTMLEGDAVDVVFSDVEMPGDMNGFDSARWIQAHRPRIGVLLTSGGPAANRINEVCEVGTTNGQAVLRKPYHAREVVRRLETILGCGPTPAR